MMPYQPNRPPPPAKPPRKFPSRSDTPWDETQRRVAELYSAKTQLLSDIKKLSLSAAVNLIFTAATFSIVLVLFIFTITGCSTVNERNLQERHSAHLVYAYKTAFNPEWKAQIRTELERRGMTHRDFKLLHEGKIGTGMHIDMATGVLPFRRISSGGTFCARGAFRSTCVRVDDDNRIKGWVRL